MVKVLTNGSNTKIGAYKFRDRKKPCLCVERENEIVIYGTFNNYNSANEFMNELGEFLGAEMVGEEE